METEKTSKGGSFKSDFKPGQQKPKAVPTSGLREFTPKVTINEITKLPSMGKAYPPNVKITHRPFLFGEVKQISGSKLSTKESYEVILEGVEVEGMDKYDLTIADVMYIGLLRKISTLGATEIIARYKCSACGNPTSIVFKTDEIEFDDIEAPKLPIEGTFSFGKLFFSPLTVKGYFALLEIGKEQDAVALYAAQVLKEDFSKVYDVLFHVEGKDARILLEIDKFMYHGVKPLNKPCPSKIKRDGKDEKCGANVEIELDGGQALLLPFRTDEQPASDSIRFGLEGER